MKLFVEVAPYLTHPLVLVGFALFIFLGLCRALLKSDKIPVVSQQVGGRALLRSINYGFVVALLVVIFGFALAFWQTSRESTVITHIIKDFASARTQGSGQGGAPDVSRDLSYLEESDALREAIHALMRYADQPDASSEVERATSLLREGDASAAEALLTEIFKRRLEEAEAAKSRAAAAARHLGAIAYIDDAPKAVEAYRAATSLEPNHTWSWILLGRLYSRIDQFPEAELAFEQALAAAERAGDGGGSDLAMQSLNEARSRHAAGSRRTAEAPHPSRFAQFSLEPQATFLRVERGDRAAAPLIVDLEKLGASPGDRVLLEQMGDYKLGSQYRGIQFFDTHRRLVGVSSRSRRLLSMNERNRVIDSVDANKQWRTIETFQKGLPTDIPGDFRIDPSFVSPIPEGATYLFVGVEDSFYSDNTDPDGDLSVRIAVETMVNSCSLYADISIDQAKRNLDHKCGFTGDRWQLSGQSHMLRCNSAKIEWPVDEIVTREAMLRECSDTPS